MDPGDVGLGARLAHEGLGAIIIAHAEHDVMPQLLSGASQDILALSHK